MFLTTRIPGNRKFDSTLDLKREGYLFIKNRTEQLHSDAVMVHMMGMPFICLSGREAARIFYDPEHFQRSGVIPRAVQKTVTGKNSVQNLDGEEHVRRKKVFLELASEGQQDKVEELTREEWEACLSRWESVERVVLFDETRSVLCRVACRWCCVPFRKDEVQKRADDFYCILDTLSGMGIKYWRGYAARRRTEQWICDVLERTRSGKLHPPKDSALYRFAFDKQPDNSVLDLQTAASELINVLLPTVAVTTYIVFSALALHEHPEWRERLRTGGKEDFQLFAKEVRRFYPFAPFLAAKVKESFRWKQFRFPKGAMVLLDLYGTDHDSRVWRKSNEFQPERFKNRSVGPFDCVETGGGDVVRGHKSPGGAIAERIMEESLDFLVNRIDYETPAQDFSFSMNRMPSIPNSGLILSDVRRRDSSGTGYSY